MMEKMEGSILLQPLFSIALMPFQENPLNHLVKGEKYHSKRALDQKLNNYLLQPLLLE